MKYFVQQLQQVEIMNIVSFNAIMENSKYLDLITSPIDVIMDSPSPSSNNCINICNNNLFPNADTEPKALTVTNEETINKINKSVRHPGQAIKIITDSSGRSVLTNQVSRTLSLDTTDDVKHKNVLKTKSLIEYIFVERKTHAKSDIEIFV